MKSLRNDLSLLSPAAQERLRRGWRLFIDGRWCDAAKAEPLAVIDPSSGEIVSQIQAGSGADIDRAVAAAKGALEYGPWHQMPPSGRERVLHRLADLIDSHADLLAEIEAVDNGMPISMAREVNGRMTSSILRYMAGWATKITGHTLDAGSEYLAYTTREPVGVVGAIVPWNAPIEQAIWKVAPALAAGCSLVIKPSEHACLTVLMLAELATEAGVPSGVLNVVTGLGTDAGEPLVRHTDVAKIAFTGSTKTGRHVQQLAGASGKRVHLELGGKSPVLIMADADLDSAIPRVASSIFDLSGQVCVAGSRIYVEAPRFNEVVDRLSARARELRLGPGLRPDSELGPLITSAQRDRVMAYVSGATQAGASVAIGGVEAGDGGFYVEPTVLVDVRQDMRCVQEEIFGPVVTVSQFDSEEEGVRLANDNAYGLAAYIWTRDIKRGHGLAKRVQCGKVAINCGAPPIASVPEGGVKASGHGRDLGREGLEQYLELKSVLVGLV